VVLPAYNEEGNIESTVSRAISYLDERFDVYEVIVVNDGSVDRTGEIVQGLSSSKSRIILVNHPENRGYGSALRSGFDKASFDYLFLMDSDGQFDIRELDRFLPFLEDSVALIGYRKKRADSLIRTLNAWLYHVYIWIVFGLKVKDIDCAFKIFPRHAYESMKPVKSGGALFSAELLIRLIRNGIRIKEIPVSHYPRLFGQQTGANLSVILRMFRECWKLRDDIRDQEK
jgi:glycosyltransferase involved in cell wall biosynthesis